MKKYVTKKIVAPVLAASLLLTVGVFSSRSSAVAAEKENSKTLEETIKNVATIKHSTQGADKEETVYIVAGADGSAEQTIVTEWLKNKGGDATLTDYTELSNIKNTNGNETFKLSDNTLTWDANGKDIHYSGKTDKELPVGVKITYYLDGVETAPKDMAGKSGHVRIRFDYTNKTTTNVPFLMASGLILDGDSFSNVTVSTGTVYNDGSRNIVVGCALPGLKKSLSLQNSDYDIPEHVEVEADTTDFSISMTMTVALNGLLDDLSIAKDSGLSGINSDLKKLEDAAKQLVDGAAGLADGAGELSNGLGTISSNSASLNSGAYSVFEALTATATKQLNDALTQAGFDAVSLTPSTYDKVLSGILDKLSSGAYSQANAVAEAKVRPLVIEKVKEEVTVKVTEAVKAKVMEKVTAQVTQSLMAKGYTEEQAAEYLKAEEGQAKVNALVEQQMSSAMVKQTIASGAQQQMATDEVKQTIETHVGEQMQSEEVQAQIEAAVSEGLAGSKEYQAIAALKKQLDSYAVFYNGLKTYTGGVDTAYNGSVELKNGADTLSAGAQKFYNEGIQKLTATLNGNYAGILSRLNTVVDAGKAYQSFGGILDGMTGDVKFVWRTKAIG